MYPQILYWKWNDELLDERVLVEKANDIMKRSSFRDIAIAPHSMTKPEASFFEPKMQELVRKANEIFTANGRRVIFDVDMRHPLEYGAFFAKAPDKFVYQARLYQLDLDENGEAEIKVAQVDHTKRKGLNHLFGLSKVGSLDAKIAGAWAFNALEGLYFEPETVVELKPCSTLETRGEELYWVVRAGKEQAGKRAIAYVQHKMPGPDRLTDEYLQCQMELIETLRDIPLYGITTDEWGIPQIIENSVTPSLYMTDMTKQLYAEHCGRDLYEDLLYFHYSPVGDRGLSILVVNKYIETIRARVTLGDHMIYDKIKEVFGKDAFVGFHPTWYCAPYGFAMETMHNGMDWWQVKRDFSQTDERVMMPIRLAMARGASEPVWYNMWYSQRTLDIRTYYAETWINARFGGRTDYLGYECYEPGVVYTFRQPGRLEMLSLMDESVIKLNDFQKALPDSRVLMLFGMEAFTNWQVYDHGVTYVSPNMKGHRDTLLLAGGIFAENVLLDLVPSSEVDRGTLRIEDGKIKYFNHDYDAIVVAYPNGMTEKALNFVKDCAKLTKNIVGVGSCEYRNDGTRCDYAFDDVATVFGNKPDPKEVAKALLDMGVKANMTANSCTFEDGSVIVTTDGKLNLFNPLETEFELDGHKIVFKGCDYLAIRIENGKPDFRFGEADVLTMDGESLI